MSALNNLLQNKSTFIMDFDGTIADTEPLNFVVIRELIAREGGDFTEDVFQSIVGKTPFEYMDTLNQIYGTNIKIEDIITDYVDLFRQKAREVALPYFPYIDKLLAQYGDRQIVVVSNQFDDILDTMLTRWGIRDKFARIISCPVDNIKKQTLYDNTAKYLGVPQNDCALFEDAQRYIDYGKGVGFATIGVENKYNKGKIAADYIIIGQE